MSMDNEARNTEANKMGGPAKGPETKTRKDTPLRPGTRKLVQLYAALLLLDMMM